MSKNSQRFFTHSIPPESFKSKRLSITLRHILSPQPQLSAVSPTSTARAYPGGSDGGGRSPLEKLDAPQGYQNNDFHLKIRAVFSLMSSEKCHITIFARPSATAMKFYYRRATADQFPSSHKIQLTNISLIRN